MNISIRQKSFRLLINFAVVFCVVFSSLNSTAPAKAASALGRNIVLNGNFETPDVTSPYWDTYYAGDTFGNWHVESGSVDHKYRTAWEPADGRQSIDLSGDTMGSISQYLMTMPLQKYLLKFSLAGNGGSVECPYAGPIKRVEVWWDSTLVDTVSFDATGHTTTDMGWEIHQYLITATGSITKLEFKSLYPYCHGPVLDMVSVQSYSGGTIPLLDIPLKYTKKFSLIATGLRFGGWVNSWFDHNSPTYAKDQKLQPWNGRILNHPIDADCTYGFNCYDGHNGIDFNHPDTDSNRIYAAAPGIVLDFCNYENDKPCIDPDTGGEKRSAAYGKWVLIRHGQPGNYGKYATFYGHLDSIDEKIAVGKEITDTKAFPIGIMGTTGTGSTGVHLHFGVYYDANGNGKWEEYSKYTDKYGVEHPKYTEVVDPYGWFGVTPDPWTLGSIYLWKEPLWDKMLVDSTGAILTTPSGKGKITVKDGIYVTPIELEAWDVTLPAPPFLGFQAVGPSIWIHTPDSSTQIGEQGGVPFTTVHPASTLETFPQPASINIQYADDDTRHFKTDQFTIYWLDEASDTWIALPTTTNTELSESTADTVNMGYFSLQAPWLCTGDTYEPNDNPGMSDSLQAGEAVVSSLFDIPDDEDWFRFDALSGNTYTLSTKDLSTGVDTVLDVFDVDGNTMLASDDDSGGGYASALVWQAPANGTYFIRVRQSPGSTSGCDSTYHLAATYVDTKAPAVQSIARIDANYTRSTNVRFEVTFSEPVTGVNTTTPFSDFTLVTTGVTGSAITAVDGSGDTYTVTVNTGTGNGTIRLELRGLTSIQDQFSNPLASLPFTTGQTYNILKSPTFGDVLANHPYYYDIEILYANGLTAGCSTSPLKFCPDQIMNRAQAAVFILRGNFGNTFVPDPATHIFKDDWTKGPWAEPWAEAMRNKGLSAGCLASPLKYCPWDQIPREQAVIFALRLKYGNSYAPPPATGTLFADMTNPSYYATSWAEQAYKDGLIPNCGTSGGKPKICPKALVSRGLGAYMIVRAKNLSIP